MAIRLTFEDLSPKPLRASASSISTSSSLVFESYGGSASPNTLSQGSGLDTTITGLNSIQANLLYGDAYSIDGGTGGNDSIVGGSDVGYVGTEAGYEYGNFLYGDAYQITSNSTIAAVGGNDTIRGGAGGNKYEALYGDSYLLRSYSNLPSAARGGNDLLFGSRRTASSNLYGDAAEATDVAQCGNDSLVGGDYTTRSVLAGDAYSMGGTSRTGKVTVNVVGGNDLIWGGRGTFADINSANANNYLIGDAFDMYSGSSGGNDTIIGGASDVNWMIGDGFTMASASKTNRDTLFSGPGNDYMYGDFVSGSAKKSPDSFVFTSLISNGADEIRDFTLGRKPGEGDSLVFSSAIVGDGTSNDQFLKLKSFITSSQNGTTMFNFGLPGNTTPINSLLVYGLSSSAITGAASYTAFNTSYPGAIQFMSIAPPTPPS